MLNYHYVVVHRATQLSLLRQLNTSSREQRDIKRKTLTFTYWWTSRVSNGLDNHTGWLHTYLFESGIQIHIHVDITNRQSVRIYIRKRI